MVNPSQAAGSRDLFTKLNERVKEILRQIEELQDAGVEYFIFNMPTSGPDAVRRVGSLLSG